MLGKNRPQERNKPIVDRELWRRVMCKVESYFSDIGGTLGLYLGMSLMSCVEFVELALDLIIYLIIRCCISMKAKKQRVGEGGGPGGGAPGGRPGARMPWEAPPADDGGFMYRGPPPSYRAAMRGARRMPNDVRDILLNM